MYKIKQSPEDFIVKEIADMKLNPLGNYAICILKKTNYNTIRAIEQIAKYLRINPKDVGFAGSKDKQAITEQYISIKNAKKQDIEKIKLKDIELQFVGYSDAPLSLGDLNENEFIITVRNLSNKEINSLENKTKKNKKITMPNYFGEQRFSETNVEIGKELVKSSFEKALILILGTNPDNKEQMKEFLADNPKNFVGALRLIHKKLLILYVHAYQSDLWNKTLKEYAKKNHKNIKIPTIGFGTEIEDKNLRKIIEKIMKDENLTFRSFINRSIPELTSEGGSRDAFIEIKNLKLIEKGKDWIKITFKLNKGSYATVAIAFLFNQLVS